MLIVMYIQINLDGILLVLIAVVQDIWDVVVLNCMVMLKLKVKIFYK